MEKVKQWLISFGVACAFIFIIGLLTSYQLIKQVTDEPLLLETPIPFQIQSGDTFYSITHDLEQKNIVQHTWRLRWLVKFHRHYGHIKQGFYKLSPGDTVKDMLHKFVEGKQWVFFVTFIEGTRVQDIIQVLANAENLTADVQQSQPLLPQLQLKDQHPEGLFFPDTYDYTLGDTSKSILKRAYARLEQELEDSWANRDKDLPYKSAYEMLIMASIIEKETSVEYERPLVAAVFVNRLRKKMRLQTDPTVIYGMGERYKGNIRKKDLREKTAYNTYQIRGLPPTPIALVGKASLEAAAHPAEVDYLYFVSKNDGSHFFSNNLKDHEAAVDEYQRKRRRKKESSKK